MGKKTKKLLSLALIGGLIAWLTNKRKNKSSEGDWRDSFPQDSSSGS